MLARTVMQPAPPITFGLKAAGWYAACERSWERLSSAFDAALVLQFGGPSGTLAGLGVKSLDVSAALARELELSNPEAPWHAQRDRLAALVAACGVYTGALGKIARDVTLMMQAEVAEASEPGGGSSSMPHKRNPAGCAIALAAATRLPGLVSTFLAGLPQEHERGVGGGHAEAPTIAAAVQATGAALQAMREVIEGLRVDADRMRANLEATGGVVFAERAMTLLAPRLGRDTAERAIAEALAAQRSSGRPFREALAAIPAVANVIAAADLASLDSPDAYVSAAEAFRLRLLAEEQVTRSKKEDGD
jgi:3-carboxy-cis,cis-muconate cycloisomerase